MNAKKEIAKHSAETQKTGGRPPPPPPSKTCLKIIEVIGVESVNGGIDSSKAPENESEPPAEAATSSDQAASQLPPKKRPRKNETQKSHVEEMLIIQQGILDTRVYRRNIFNFCLHSLYEIIGP